MSFDRFAQQITKQVVRPWFFWLIAGAILAWLPTLVLWDPGPSDLLVDSLTNPLSLLLLVLLQNSQSRQERALDRRQDQLERSVSLLLRQAAVHEPDEATRRSLSDAAENLMRSAEESEALATAGTQRSADQERKDRG